MRPTAGPVVGQAGAWQTYVCTQAFFKPIMLHAIASGLPSASPNPHECGVVVSAVCFMVQEKSSFDSPSIQSASISLSLSSYLLVEMGFLRFSFLYQVKAGLEANF